MRRKPTEHDFCQEMQAQIHALESRIGQEVPLSNRYVRGPRPILVSIAQGTATLRFPNGAVLLQIPLRDLVDDTGYWKP